MPDKVWYLRRLNLFDDMKEEEVEAVSRELRMRTCQPGAPFPTRQRDRVYLLKSGRMRLYQLTADGHEITTAVLDPGQLFGLSSLMGGGGWATHAEPLVEAVVCEVSAHDFVGMLARHPLLMTKVVMIMARQMFQLEQTIESLASRRISSRLAGYLLTQLDEGERLDGGVLLAPMTVGSAGSLLPIVHVVTSTSPRCRVHGPATRRIGLNVNTAHWLTSGAASFARGLNDTPKIWAIGAFGLVPGTFHPTQLLVLIAFAMAAGGVAAAVRVSRGLGENVVRMNHREGFTADLTTAFSRRSGGQPRAAHVQPPTYRPGRSPVWPEDRCDGSIVPRCATS